MANALGINYSDVLKNVESIKTARLQREGIGLDNQSKRLALGEGRKAVERNDNAIALRQDAIAGDETALPKLVAINPDEATGFMKTLATMSAFDRSEINRGIEVMGKAAAFVLGSNDPTAAYSQLLQALPEEERAKYPPEYDEQFVRLQLARASEFDELFKSVTAKDETLLNAGIDSAAADADELRDIATEDRKTASTIATENRSEGADIRAEGRAEDRAIRADQRKNEAASRKAEQAQTYRLNELEAGANLTRETNRLKAQVEADIEAGAGRTMKSADSNAIYSRAASLFGGTYTQSAGGDYVFTGLDKTSSTRALKIAELAETIWRGQTSIGHSEAARQAAEMLGFDFSDNTGLPAGFVIDK